MTVSAGQELREVAATDPKTSPQEADAAPGPSDFASQMPDPAAADKVSFTFHHARYEAGQHWFSAEDDGEEVGHAYVIEQQGPGGPHAEIKRLWTNPHYRERGIGSRLLDNVGEHFQGRELRLKPYPVDEDGDQDEGDLREYYRNRGFEGYELRDGDPFELHDYMAKRASCGPAAGPATAAGAAAGCLARVSFPNPVLAGPAVRSSRSQPAASPRRTASTTAAPQARPRGLR